MAVKDGEAQNCIWCCCCFDVLMLHVSRCSGCCSCVAVAVVVVQPLFLDALPLALPGSADFEISYRDILCRYLIDIYRHLVHLAFQRDLAQQLLLRTCQETLARNLVLLAWSHMILGPFNLSLWNPNCALFVVSCRDMRWGPL